MRRPGEDPLYKRLQKSMFIVILRSNIRFKVDGYETHVTLGKKKKKKKKKIYIYIYIYIYICVCVCVCVSVCVFQVSRPYLVFFPDPKHFIVKCEHNLSNMLENAGKCSENCIFYIKYFDKLET